MSPLIYASAFNQFKWPANLGLTNWTSSKFFSFFFCPNRRTIANVRKRRFKVPESWLKPLRSWRLYLCCQGQQNISKARLWNSEWEQTHFHKEDCVKAGLYSLRSTLILLLCISFQKRFSDSSQTPQSLLLPVGLLCPTSTVYTCTLPVQLACK